MKVQNGLLAKTFNRETLELETFDLIDMLSEGIDERIEEYKTHASSLEMDVSQGVIPFPQLSRAEENTWSVYCPQKNKVKEYKQTIPLEVIRLIDEVEKRGMFEMIEVWSENKEEVDPIVVGYQYLTDEDREKGYTFQMGKFLLARWGLALKPYEEIREQSKKMWKENFITESTKKIKEMQRGLEDVEENCVEYFRGGSQSFPF